MENGGWATRLMLSMLSEEADYTVVYNLGIPGEMMVEAQARIGNEAAYRKPGLSILALGVNDTEHDSARGLPPTPEDAFKDTTTRVIDTLKQYSEKVLLLSILNVHPENPKKYSNEIISRFNNILSSVAAERGIEQLDVFGLLDPMTDFSPDGVHPSSSGHKKIFEKVLPVAKRLIGNS
jgi:lysophospholipase L1-like esterase